MGQFDRSTYRLNLPSVYEVNATFNMSDLIPCTGSSNAEANPPDLRSTPFLEGGDDDKPLAKGPTIRAMTRRIQEVWASFDLSRPKLMFICAKEDMKT